MHILFLSHYFPPENNAPASRTFEHTRRWAEDPDVRVTVITNHPNHPYGILYKDYVNRWITREKTAGIDVIRVKTYLAPNAGTAKRTLNYLFFVLASFFGSFLVKKPDIVVATSPQFFCALAGYLVSRFKGCKFVFELRDILPESIVAVGAVRRGLVIRILEKLELFLYRAAHIIVALTDAFKENLVGRGVPAGKIHIVKNGVDPETFRPTGVPVELAKEIGIENRFVVSYIGTIGMAHAVDQLIDVAGILQDAPEIVFLIVGEGASKKTVEDRLEKSKLNNVIIRPGVPKEQVARYYALSDLCLVTLIGTPLFKTVIPSKIFEIMAMSRPILGTVDGECRGIIDQAGCGVFVEPESIPDIARTIKELYDNPARLSEMGHNGRKYVERHFDRNKLAERYLVLLKKSVTKETAQSRTRRVVADSLSGNM